MAEQPPAPAPGSGGATKPTRLECLQALAPHVGERDIAVAALGETEALWHMVSRGRPGNFYIRNGMSMPTSVALGLAVAQPQRRVWALEGDGGMLMNLGSLTTIAAQSPEQLRIIVFVNRVYQASGGQEIPSGVDFPLLARGSGFRSVFSVSEVAALPQQLAALAAAPGPAFLACETAVSSLDLNQLPRTPLPREFKREFARFLGLA